jgi:hypothetical protein
MSNGRIFNPRYIADADMGADYEGPWLNIQGMTYIGFQPAWSAADPRVLVMAAGNVVASTGTWNLPAGNTPLTQADVGAVVTVAGAANSGNNGAKTILTVVDADTFTTATTSLVNETFGGGVSASLQQVLPTGTFKVQTSADARIGGPSTQGPIELSDILGPVDVPMTLADGEPDPNPAADESSSKFRLSGIDDPYIRFVYDWTSGGGKLNVGASGKSL